MRKEESLLTSSVEKVRAVLARERETLRELPHELDDLRDVVVVFAIPRSQCGIEQEVAASDQLEDLDTLRQAR